MRDVSGDVQFTPKQKKILDLILVSNYSYRDISSVFPGISHATIKKAVDKYNRVVSELSGRTDYIDKRIKEQIDEQNAILRRIYIDCGQVAGGTAKDADKDYFYWACQAKKHINHSGVVRVHTDDMPIKCYTPKTNKKRNLHLKNEETKKTPL